MNQLLITLEASRDLSEISDYFLEQSIVNDGIEILRVVSGYRDLQDTFKTN